MSYCRSNGHISDHITWPWKVKVVILVHCGLHSSKLFGDGVSVTRWKSWFVAIPFHLTIYRFHPQYIVSVQQVNCLLFLQDFFGFSEYSLSFEIVNWLEIECWSEIEKWWSKTDLRSSSYCWRVDWSQESRSSWVQVSYLTFMSYCNE